MDTIQLHNVLPQVFAGRTGLVSDVWLTDVEFRRGTAYLVAAESGRGKSSFCAYVYGYRKDYSGSITFDGQSVASLGINEWAEVRRRRIAYLPQEMRLFPELTALENVELKNRLTGYHTDAEIRTMFERLGIADKLDSSVAKLSIGQQQRVALIRTLCQPADFYLLDEPVSHLDAANNRTVAEMVMEEARRQGAGVIATSVGNNLDITVGEVLNL